MGKEPVTRKTISLPDTMWERIARYQEDEQIATEAEAVRRLLRKALGREARR